MKINRLLYAAASVLLLAWGQPILRVPRKFTSFVPTGSRPYSRNSLRNSSGPPDTRLS